jgi:Ion channel
MIRILSVVLGFLLLGIAWWDAFSTVVLPRTLGAVFSPARAFYLVGWRIWRPVGFLIDDRRRRQIFLTSFGPLSVFFLLGLWAVMILVSFALLHLGFKTQLNADAGIGSLLYLSGTTFFTLGLGDVVPLNPLGRGLVVTEVGMGIIFLAMIIGYLPLLDQAYAEREVGVLLLESRAGSPQSAVRLLRRFCRPESAGVLATILQEGERWAAELSQSHNAHPVLALYRSQHLDQSWLISLTTLLDACALLIVARSEVPAREARAAFRMGVIAAVDLARMLGPTPGHEPGERLPPGAFQRLCAALERSGVVLAGEQEAEVRLTKLRALYEPSVLALSARLLVPLPVWVPALEEDEDERIF